MTYAQKGFGALEGLLILIAVSLLGGMGWFIWHTKYSTGKLSGSMSTPKTNIVSGTGKSSEDDAIILTGKVQSDGCVNRQSTFSNGATIAAPPIGDVGCSITVNNYIITVVHGNINVSAWGKLDGFEYNQDITGRAVEVRAHRSGSAYAISAASDYVKLVN